MECVAENAHGDPVSAKASLTIYDGRSYQSVDLTEVSLMQLTIDLSKY